MKTCTRCNKEKNLTEFHKLSHTKDKLNPRCKECRREEYLRSSSHLTRRHQFKRFPKLEDPNRKICPKCEKEKNITDFSLKCSRCKECRNEDSKLKRVLKPAKFIITDTEKECHRCRKLLPFSSFYVDNNTRDKHCRLCKKCSSEYKKEVSKFKLTSKIR